MLPPPLRLPLGSRRSALSISAPPSVLPRVVTGPDRPLILNTDYGTAFRLMVSSSVPLNRARNTGGQWPHEAVVGCTSGHWGQGAPLTGPAFAGHSAPARRSDLGGRSGAQCSELQEGGGAGPRSCTAAWFGGPPLVQAARGAGVLTSFASS